MTASSDPNIFFCAFEEQWVISCSVVTVSSTEISFPNPILDLSNILEASKNATFSILVKTGIEKS